MGASQDALLFLLQSDKAPPVEGTLSVITYNLDAGPNQPKYNLPRRKVKEPKAPKPKIRLLILESEIWTHQDESGYISIRYSGQRGRRFRC